MRGAVDNTSALFCLLTSLKKNGARSTRARSAAKTATYQQDISQKSILMIEKNLLLVYLKAKWRA
jgi:hypothetical protein